VLLAIAQLDLLTQGNCQRIGSYLLLSLVNAQAADQDQPALRAKNGPPRSDKPIGIPLLLASQRGINTV
jgi:hypothetical protein